MNSRASRRVRIEVMGGYLTNKDSTILCLMDAKQSKAFAKGRRTVEVNDDEGTIFVLFVSSSIWLRA